MSVIEVFADITCPFTHVGLRRLVEHRARIGRTDVRLVVRAWPLELVNGAPLTGAFVTEEVEQIQKQVAPDLFQGFCPDVFPSSSLPALRLTHDAYAISDATGERVALELRDRLFERGEDISDPAILAAVARDHHVVVQRGAAKGDPVRDEWELGQRRGVLGSPHFFAGEVDVFCPALRIAQANGHLQIEFDQVRFTAFMSAFFA